MQKQMHRVKHRSTQRTLPAGVGPRVPQGCGQGAPWSLQSCGRRNLGQLFSVSLGKTEGKAARGRGRLAPELSGSDHCGEGLPVLASPSFLQLQMGGPQSASSAPAPASGGQPPLRPRPGRPSPAPAPGSLHLNELGNTPAFPTRVFANPSPRQVRNPQVQGHVRWPQVVGPLRPPQQPALSLSLLGPVGH